MSAMKIEVLEEGKEFKNYRDLCEHLGIVAKRGNSKNAQMKEISRFCVLVKGKGHSLIVSEVFEIPLPSERKGGGSVYGDMLDLLLMDYLIDEKESRGKVIVNMTRNSLLERMSMVNGNYSYCSYNIPHLSIYTEIDEQVIYDFFNTTNSTFKYSLESSLNRLRSRALAMWTTVTMLCIGKSVKSYRKATDSERHLILACEKLTLEEMGYSEIHQVRASKNWNLFRRRVKKKLSYHIENLDYYFTSYEIVINSIHMVDEHNKLLYKTLKSNERDETKSKLNIILCSRLLENAENRQKGTKENTYMSKIRHEFGYLKDNKVLADLLINRKAPNIKKEIDSIKKKK